MLMVLTGVTRQLVRVIVLLIIWVLPKMAVCVG